MTQIDTGNIDWWYIHLAKRTDRVEHLKAQLRKAGIEAHCFDACGPGNYHGPEENVKLMRATPNTIGNWLSHTACIGSAAGLTEGVLGVLEDDCLICSDFQVRMNYIEEHFDKPWDIFFLGATFHCDRAAWHPELGRDYELTDTRHIVRTFGAFSNQGYLINPTSADKILCMMQERMPYSRGSDHALIQIQPELECYCFVPGMVFQVDGYGDVGGGWTQFSDFFESLGPHIWCDKLDDFDYDSWVEKIKTENYT